MDYFQVLKNFLSWEICCCFVNSQNHIYKISVFVKNLEDWAQDNRS